jgi:hypothetical protein
VFDNLAEQRLIEAEGAVVAALSRMPEVVRKINGGKPLEESDLASLLKTAQNAVQPLRKAAKETDGNTAGD